MYKDALFFTMKSSTFILSCALAALLLLAQCSGSRKYFKAGERLEKKGLVNEAAAFYLEALQRKPSNVDARIRLRETGQKYVSSLATDFFRRFNTQDYETALSTYEKLKQFHETSRLLNVNFEYPKAYDDDYKEAMAAYVSSNYNKAKLLITQRKYQEALPYVRNVTRYNSEYLNIKLLQDVAVCEPLYQSAINAIEMKNYSLAQQHISGIVKQNESYKDTRDLAEMVNAQLERSVLLFNPQSGDARERNIEGNLYNTFNDYIISKTKLKVINNSPFQNANTNVINGDYELLAAIKKATGADLFYIFDVYGISEQNSGESRNSGRAYYEVKIKKDSVTTITEYKPVDYVNVFADRFYGYTFMYKIINAKTNQVVTSKSQALQSSDAIDYNAFSGRLNPNVATTFPYNPAEDGKRNVDLNQWRNKFNNKKTLSSMETLLNNVYQSNIKIMQGTVSFLK